MVNWLKRINMYESLVQKIESLEKTNEQLRNKGYECFVEQLRKEGCERFVGLINYKEYFQAYAEIENVSEDKKYAAAGVLKEQIINKSCFDIPEDIATPKVFKKLYSHLLTLRKKVAEYKPGKC